MTQLRKLQVSGNHIQEMPEAIGNLTELRHLNMADNQIAALPDSIGPAEETPGLRFLGKPPVRLRTASEKCRSCINYG